MSYLELVCLDGQQSYKTGVSWNLPTPEQGRVLLCAAKPWEVPAESAGFVLDCYNSRGEPTHEVFLDAQGFERLTGEAPRSVAYYRAVDLAYWVCAKARLRVARQPVAQVV